MAHSCFLLSIQKIMNNKRIRYLISILFVPLSCVALLVSEGNCQGSDLPTTVITHESVDYFITHYPLRLQVHVEDQQGITETRCYFRYQSSNQYVFVEPVIVSENTYTCVLPSPNDDVAEIEYFFLVVNNKSQVIRSKKYVVLPKKSSRVPAWQLTELPDGYVLYYELNEPPAMKSLLIRSEIDFTVVDREKWYGYYVNVYDRDSVGFVTSQEGYFGGFFFDDIREVAFPIKGIIPLLESLDGSEDNQLVPAERSAQRHPLKVEGTVGPDIAGDNWSGVFYTTGFNNMEIITAKIVVAPWTSTRSYVDIITSKSGLGHSFTTGWISYLGDMILYDDYDGEDWTTHWGPAKSTRLRILDYIYPPSAEDPNPPKNVIELEREEVQEPEPEPEEPQTDFLQAVYMLLI